MLRFVRESPGKVGRREIARAFGIRGNDRALLTDLLRTLEAEGEIEGRRARRRPAGTLPPVTVLEVDGLDPDGALTARPQRWEDAEPPPPITLDPAPRGVPEPGVGDRVLARLRPAADGRYLARPMRVLDAGPRRVVGVFHADGRGGGVIEPAGRRSRRDFAVQAGETAGARTGELVVGETREGRRLGLPDARVVERLGDVDSPGAISLAAIHAHGLPLHFPDEALAEAERQEAPTLEGRADLRALPLVTIDGADARDFDDAVWARADPAPDNEGGWRAVVAIADVAHFVPQGGALDRAARERGNSAYFPDRVVPMLPEALSAGLCSLKPGEDRACLAAHLRIDASGTLLDWRFERALMRSAQRLTYDGVQQAVAQGGAAWRRLSVTRSPRSTASTARSGRRGNGAARSTSTCRSARSRSPRTARWRASLRPALRQSPPDRGDDDRGERRRGERARSPAQACMYRVHDRPDMAKLDALREFLRGRGLALPQTRAIRAESFNRILAGLDDPRDAAIASLMILRAQAQAAYSPGNIGHFGLGLARYAHFTSPIRRYADLLVHRALIAAYGLGAGGAGDAEPGALERLGSHISTTERRAQAAERDAGDRYCAAYLAGRIGAEFQGRIAGVTRFGVFVSLDETGAEGLVPGRTLGTARPRHDARRHTLEVDGRTLRLGDPVVVALREADPAAGGLVFSLLAVKGEAWQPPPQRDGGRRGRRRTRR